MAGSVGATHTVRVLGADGGGHILRPGPLAVIADDLRGWLVNRIGELTRQPTEQIDPAAPIAGFGLNSLSAAALVAELSDRIGYRIPAELLYRIPTIDALVWVLADPGTDWVQDTADPTESTVIAFSQPARGNGHSAGIGVFWVGGGTGDFRYLTPLARAVGWTGPTYGLLRLDVLSDQGPNDGRMLALGRYLDDIRQAQPHGPYFLSGHSYGGAVAYELGCRLSAAGEQVRVVAIDTHLFDVGRRPVPSPDLLERRALAVFFAGHQAAAQNSFSNTIDWAQPLAGLRSEIARIVAGKSNAKIEEHLRQDAQIFVARNRAVRAYVPSPSSFPILLLKATSGFCRYGADLFGDVLNYDPYAYWTTERMSGLQVKDVPGDHFTMIRPPHADTVAQAVREYLAEGMPSAPRDRA